jgi:hypothetical protein
MKTNFYILLVLLFSFSLGNAQSTSEVVENETMNVISISDIDVTLTTTIENTVIENDSLLINVNDLKETIARSSSDIRIYLNRQRKVGTIGLVFQNINKAVRA